MYQFNDKLPWWLVITWVSSTSNLHQPIINQSPGARSHLYDLVVPKQSHNPKAASSSLAAILFLLSLFFSPHIFDDSVAVDSCMHATPAALVD